MATSRSWDLQIISPSPAAGHYSTPLMPTANTTTCFRCGCSVPSALYFKILFHPFPLHHDVSKTCSITSLIAKNGFVVVTSSTRGYGADNINTGLRQ